MKKKKHGKEWMCRLDILTKNKKKKKKVKVKVDKIV